MQTKLIWLGKFGLSVVLAIVILGTEVGMGAAGYAYKSNEDSQQALTIKALNQQLALQQPIATAEDVATIKKAVEANKGWTMGSISQAGQGKLIAYDLSKDDGTTEKHVAVFSGQQLISDLKIPEPK